MSMEYRFSFDSETEAKARLLLEGGEGGGSGGVANPKTPKEKAVAQVSMEGVKTEHAKAPFTTEAAIFQMSLSHYSW